MSDTLTTNMPPEKNSESQNSQQAEAVVLNEKMILDGVVWLAEEAIQLRQENQQLKQILSLRQNKDFEIISALEGLNFLVHCLNRAQPEPEKELFKIDLHKKEIQRIKNLDVTAVMENPKVFYALVQK